MGQKRGVRSWELNKELGVGGWELGEKMKGTAKYARALKDYCPINTAKAIMTRLRRVFY